MTWTWIASLQGLALLLLVGEIFLPTFGVLTLATLGALGWSLWLARDLGPGLWILAGADLLLFPILAWFLLSRVGPGPMGLSASLARGSSAAPEVRVGQVGTTLTALRPVGRARIGGTVLDVVSSGHFLSANRDVVVVESSSNRVVVRAATEPETRTGAKGE